MINAKTAFSLLLSGAVACQLAFGTAFILPVHAAASNSKSQDKDEPGLNDVPDMSSIHTSLAPPLPKINVAPAASTAVSTASTHDSTASSSKSAASNSTATKKWRRRWSENQWRDKASRDISIYCSIYCGVWTIYRRRLKKRMM